VLSQDYSSDRSEGFKIFRKANRFIEQHFKDTGEGTTKVEVRLIAIVKPAEYTDTIRRSKIAEESSDCPGLKLLSLVMPTLDVDFHNGTKATLRERAAQEQDKTKPVEDVVGRVRRMDKMKHSYAELKVQLRFPRSLYVPYSTTGHYNAAKLDERIKDQALCRYLWPDETSGPTKQNVTSNTSQQYTSPNQNGPSSQAHHGLPTVQPLPEQHNNPPTQATWRKRTVKPNPYKQRGAVAPPPQREQNEPYRQGIIIPELWLLLIMTGSKQRRVIRGKG
jgi:hypothetical protein